MDGQVRSNHPSYSYIHSSATNTSTRLPPSNISGCTREKPPRRIIFHIHQPTESLRANMSPTPVESAVRTAEQKAAASREKYLRTLRILATAKTTCIMLCDGREVNNVHIAAVQPDSSAFLVRRLATPLGELPAAVVRGEDVLVVAAKFGAG